MSEHPAVLPAQSAGWDANLLVYACDTCQWRYLIPANAEAGLCPHCFRGELTCLPEDMEEIVHPYPPELVIPFRLEETTLAEKVRAFVKSIPFPPHSLNPTALRKNMRAVYLPIWLIDGKVLATWQAETGFYYDVVSHQEIYEQDRGGWKTIEVKEQRLRWENRVGQIDRAYQNLPATALESAPRLEKALGGFSREQAEQYQPGLLHGAAVRLPDFTPREAWSEAAAAFQRMAAEECQSACQADQMRQFRWKAQFSRLNWTLLLLPVYSAFYQDDDGKPQPVMIHGQTGAVTGARRASMRRARQASLVLLVIGIVAILTGLLLNWLSVSNSGLGTAAVIFLLVGLASALGTLVPVAIAWDFNRHPEKTG